MKLLIDALNACKTKMPHITKNYKNHARFAEGFDEAVKLLVGITVTRPELVYQVKKLAIFDVRTDLEQRAINLRESIALIERHSNRLASSGYVKESNRLEDSLESQRFELIKIAETQRCLKELTEKL